MSRFDPEVIAIRETKARAVQAFGEDSILGIANGGVGVWLTDNSYVPKDRIPASSGPDL